MKDTTTENKDAYFESFLKASDRSDDDFAFMNEKSCVVGVEQG